MAPTTPRLLPRLAPILALLVAAACDPPKTEPAASAPASASARASAPASASAVTPASAPAAPAFGPFGELVRTLSEPGGDFISDNLISNETSYLQTADALAARPAGGVYVGVGPEQNFTYLALTRPRLAFIVDIRRDNLLQHLYYRFLFEEAESRSHFLALLVGRPYDAATAPPTTADVDAVLKHAETKAPDPKLFATTVDRAMKRMQEAYGVTLTDKDKRALARMTQVFFDKQLDLRFELKETSGRKYPSLRELVGAADPAGKKRGFLATDETFRFVQTMEREGRVVPVVGDFAGDGAFPAIAAFLQKNDLRVSTFYVSNVEQYLLEPPTWSKWIRNVAALPRTDDALFLRCYLDQGKKHPKQMEGHRTATVLAKIDDFVTREQKAPTRSWFKIATEGNLD
ncbi:hypothetical protein [Polyangium sorediatum]|uniref:DUF7790 domain-containing protein n=1 Tax=Polyangium sorediatum TaxID=889274 RepID=A0ABT6NW45_9BACT|nr:hypothetical protein [Polyangium sorediatum]MDI1432533.1 hypothetical protein [Polyangium sorediatum]